MLTAFQILGDGCREEPCNPATARLYLGRSCSPAGQNDERFKTLLTADQSEETVFGGIEVVVEKSRLMGLMDEMVAEISVPIRNQASSILHDETEELTIGTGRRYCRNVTVQTKEETP
jgi:hypothetical protein